MNTKEKEFEYGVGVIPAKDDWYVVYESTGECLFLYEWKTNLFTQEQARELKQILQSIHPAYNYRVAKLTFLD